MTSAHSTSLWPGAASERRAEKKRSKALEPGTPVDVAASQAIDTAVKGVARALKALEESKHIEPTQVHQVRVGTRRVEAALSAFEPWVRSRLTSELRKRLKGLRRAVATARRCDVQINMLERLAEGASANEVTVLNAIIKRLHRERHDAREHIQDQAADRLSEIKRWGKRTRRATRQRHDNESLADVAAQRLPVLADAMIPYRANLDPSTDDLHSLRIEGKRARYALELLSSCLPAEEFRALYGRMEQFQERLGAFNDECELLALLDRWSRKTLKLADKCDLDELEVINAIESITRRVRQQAAANRRAFLDWWFSHDADAMLAAFRTQVIRPEPQDVIAEAKPDVLARIDAPEPMGRTAP